MAADLPEAYERFMDAFQFIKDVPVDWDTTVVIDAEPGDYVAIARKGRGAEDWYIGAITDENPRSVAVSLNFLEPGKRYTAVIYGDAADADWEENPMAYQIGSSVVTSQSILQLSLAAGGGAAVMIRGGTGHD